MHDSFLTINRLQIYELNHTPMNKVISSFCSSYIQYSSCIQFPEINLPQAWKEIRIHIMPDDWTLSNLAQRLFCYPQGNAFYMKVRPYAHNMGKKYFFGQSFVGIQTSPNFYQTGFSIHTPRELSNLQSKKKFTPSRLFRKLFDNARRVCKLSYFMLMSWTCTYQIHVFLI